jgi:hypothetical protein
MSRPVHQLRAVVSAVLLLVQALGLGHLALAEHAAGEAGAEIELAPEGASDTTAETHSESAPHVCGHDAVVHAEMRLVCMVVAAWTAPSLAPQRVVLAAPSPAGPRCAARASVVAPQFDVLSRAPKSSPPQHG